MTVIAFFIRIFFFVGSLVSCTKLDQEQVEKDVEIIEKIIEDVREIEAFPSSDYTAMV